MLYIFSKSLLIINLLLFLLCLPACTGYIPIIPVGEIKDKISQEDISTLTSAVTTRNDVLQKFHQPDIIWEIKDTQSVFIYKWDRIQDSYGALLIGAPPPIYVPFPYSEKGRVVDQGFLLIFIDESDRVAKVLRANKSLNESYGHFLNRLTLDYEKIRSGERTIVLLRIIFEKDKIDGKTFQEVFHGRNPRIGFRLGNFETGGEPKYIDPIFLSDQTRADGWLYFKLEPDLYYLSLSPNFFNQPSPLWRLDISPTSGLIYIGTLHIPCLIESQRAGFISAPEISLLWWKSILLDEEESARKIAANFFPELKTFKTMLMVKHSGPIILRTPMKKD